MDERVIILEGIEPINLYGVNNLKWEKIKGYFPRLKIIARGHVIKALGEPGETAFFEEKIFHLVNHFQKENELSVEKIGELLEAEGGFSALASFSPDRALLYGTEGRVVKAKTKHQVEMVEKARLNDLVFAIGPAGTGKTYMAIALAVRALRDRVVKRIILSRPAVEAEEKLGFLPGDMKDKLDPYLQPLYDALNDMIPPKKLELLMKDRVIQIAPLAFMRGRTLAQAFVILDEAQNATLNQLKMFLTRMGESTKYIVTGDLTQIDLPRKSQSGLVTAGRLLRGVEGVETVRFDPKDIVRHRLVKHIVDAFDKHELEQAEHGKPPKP